MPKQHKRNKLCTQNLINKMYNQQLSIQERHNIRFNLASALYSDYDNVNKDPTLAENCFRVIMSDETDSLQHRIQAKYYIACINTDNDNQTPETFTLYNEILHSPELEPNQHINVQLGILYCTFHGKGTNIDYSIAYNMANNLHQNLNYPFPIRMLALCYSAEMIHNGYGQSKDYKQAFILYKKILKSKYIPPRLISNIICLMQDVYYEPDACSTYYNHITYNTLFGNKFRANSKLYEIHLSLHKVQCHSSIITSLLQIINDTQLDPITTVGANFTLAILYKYILNIKASQILLYFTQIASNPYAPPIYATLSKYHITNVSQSDFIQYIEHKLEESRIENYVMTYCCLNIIYTHITYKPDYTICFKAHQYIIQASHDFTQAITHIEMLTQYNKYLGTITYRDVTFITQNATNAISIAICMHQIRRLLHLTSMETTLKLNSDIWTPEDNWNLACDFIEIIYELDSPGYQNLVSYHPNTNDFVVEFRKYKQMTYSMPNISDMDLTVSQLQELISIVRKQETMYTSPQIYNFMKYAIQYKPNIIDMLDNDSEDFVKYCQVLQYDIINHMTLKLHDIDERCMLAYQMYQNLYDMLLNVCQDIKPILKSIVEQRNELLNIKREYYILTTCIAQYRECDMNYTKSVYRAIRGAMIIIADI